MKKIALYIIFLFLCIINLDAAYVSVLNTNTESFPSIENEFFFFDSNLDLIDNEDKIKSIKITENGENKNFNLEFSISPTLDQLSTVLSVEMSESITQNKLNIIRQLLNRWIGLSQKTNSEYSLLSFASLSFIETKFTQDNIKTTDIINNLNTRFGFDLNNACFNQNTGALQIATDGQYKKNIIFIVDGYDTFNKELLINRALNINAKVSFIVLDLSASESMKEVANRTNGFIFEQIKDKAEADDAMIKIFYLLSGAEKSKLTWENTSCFNDVSIVFDFNINNDNIKKFKSYRVEDDKLSTLFTQSSSILFSDNIINQENKRTIIYEAKNSDIFIDSVVSSNSKFAVTNYFLHQIPPTLLKEGEKIEFEITFIPSDETYQFTEFLIYADACNQAKFYARSSDGKNTSDEKLEITFPTGAEKLIAGSDTLIKWSGILPDDKIKIQYKYDSQDLSLVKDSATGLNYLWRVPNIETNSAIINILSQDENNEKIKTLNVGKSVFSLDWNKEKNIIACGTESNIQLWDVDKSEKVAESSNDMPIVSSLKWHPNNQIIFSNGDDNQEDLLVWNSNTMQVIQKILNPYPNESIYSIDISDDKLLAGLKNGRALIWNLSDFSVYRDIKLHDERINEIKFSNNQKYLASISSEQKLLIYDLDSDSIILDSAFFNNWILAITFSPDDRFIAFAGIDTYVYVYDLIKNEIAHTIDIQNRRIQDLEWSSDSRYILCSSDYPDVLLINTLDWDIEYAFQNGHTDLVKTAIWNHNSTYLASGAYDEKIMIWSPLDIPLDDILILEDESDPFSIISPQIFAIDILFADQLHNTKKDTILYQYIQNPNSYKIRVDSIKISGTDASQFSFDAQRSTPFFIKANEKITSYMNFDASKIGLNTAVLEIYTQNQELKYNIRANVIEYDFNQITELIDFSKVLVNNQKDTLEIPFLEKIGIKDFDLDNITFLNNPDNAFTIIDKKIISDTLFLSISFLADEEGLYNANIAYKNGISNYVLQLIANGLDYDIDFEKNIYFEDQICTKNIMDTSVVISNLTDTDINIKSVKIIDDNFNSFDLLNDLSGQTINSSSEKKIEIRFTPKFASLFQAKIEIITFVDIDQEKTSLINLFAKVDSSKYELEHEEIVFNELEPLRTYDTSLVLTNLASISQSWPKYTSSKFQILSYSPELINPGETSIITLQFNGADAGESINEQFEFIDTCGNSKILLLKANIRSEYSEIQTLNKLRLNDLICEETIDTFLIINSIGEKELLINDIYIEDSYDEYFEIDDKLIGNIIHKNTYDTLFFSYKPDIAKQNLEDVKLIIESDSKNSEKRTIFLTCRKISTDFTLNRNEISFQSAKINGVNEEILEIENIGDISLMWNIPIDLGYFAITEMNPKVIDPGESAELKIEFNPEKAGVDYDTTYSFVNFCNDEKQLDLSGSVNQNSLKIYIREFCGFTSDTVKMLIKKSDLNINEEELSDIKCEISMQEDILLPLNNDINVEYQNDSLFLDFIIDKDNLVSDTLAIYDFAVLKANEIYNTLSFDANWENDLGHSLISKDGLFIAGCDIDKRDTVQECDSIILLQSFPNPTDGYMRIEYKIPEDMDIELYIWNMKAQKVKEVEKGRRRKGFHFVEIDLGNYVQGVYFYQLVTRKCVITGKFEINR